MDFEQFKFNKYQSTLLELKLDLYPEEIQQEFIEFLETVPYLKNLTSPNRPYAKDCPRDSEGKIIVDLTNPPIIVDTDYFRPVAIYFLLHGVITNLRPSGNPNSAYGKWIREEVRRCFEGYIRPSDGAWVTGDMYFFLNYCPILKVKKVKGKKGIRVMDFPDYLEGQWLWFMYLQLARDNAKHAFLLAARGKGKSYCLAAITAKRFILGDYDEVDHKIINHTETFIAAYRKDYLTDDGILNKFLNYIDFCADYTLFPRKRLISSLNNMHWLMGYKENDSEARRGSLNEVIGISVKDTPSKLRGKRGLVIGLEEAGAFNNLKELYGTLRPSMEDGDVVFGQIIAQGTSGSTESDFSAAQDIMYSPKAYNMYPVTNVYDKAGLGRKEFTFFFPGYLNRNGCYDDDGISDCTKALLLILINRYNVKYNSRDSTLITSTIAEIPIVPQEAILKARGNIFPTVQLTQRLNELDNNPNTYDDVYVGTLVLSKIGEVVFKPTNDEPIRVWPTKDNKVHGALEIYDMPLLDPNGKVYDNRYLVSLDPVDSDLAETMSLTSAFVLDLFTDRIVAEYTGRYEYADDNYELVRKMCIFYNGMCMYESNIKGFFAYMKAHNSLNYLALTPKYLRDLRLIKEKTFYNSEYGIRATAGINNYGDRLIRDWLLKPVTITDKDGNESTVPNLMFLKNRALILELIGYNPLANFDRERSLSILMLYRQEKIIDYEGDLTKSIEQADDKDYAGNDDFFTENYDNNPKVNY